MSEQEIKNIYVEIGQSLKSKSNELYLNSESEIRTIGARITEKIENILQYSGIKYDSYKLEQLVSDELTSSLISDSKSLYSGNFQILNNFNDSIQKFIVSEQQNEYEKQKKVETVDMIISKFDYAMSEYRKKEVNSYEQFNNFFRQALRALPLYDRQDVVEQIKNILGNELKYYDKLQFDSRNKIIRSNTDRILENVSMVKNTDMIIESEKVSSESIPPVVSQNAEINNKVEGNISQVQQVEQDLTGIKKENAFQEEADKVIYTPIVEDVKKEETITNTNDFVEEKVLRVPTQVSNEEKIMNQVQNPIQQMEVKEDYQILDDGTIVKNGPISQQAYQSMQNNYNQAPTLVSNEQRLVEVVRQNLTYHVWQEIGLSASRMDKNIDLTSNDILNKINQIMIKNGVQANPQFTNRIVVQLNEQLKEINNNLSTNMVKLFENVNAETINSVSQAFLRPEEIRNQDIEQSLQVYKDNTSIKEYRLTCQKQFSETLNKICMQNGIGVNTPIYQELNRMLLVKRSEMEQQFFRMYDNFSKNNASYMYTTITAMSFSYENIQGMQQELNQQQVQSLLLYNKREYEKSYYNEMAQAQIEEHNGFSR